jgi:ubiquinol oxidase
MVELATSSPCTVRNGRCQISEAKVPCERDLRPYPLPSRQVTMNDMTPMPNDDDATERSGGATITSMRTPAPQAQGAMATLSHEELLASHAVTLAAPRRHYGLGGKTLFALLDVVYGKKRTLSKFKVIELVARVPYQAWEQVAYIAITHTHESPTLARRVFDRVTESRAQEDNEQWHLLILEEMITARHTKEGRIRFGVIPQVLAFVYYQLSLLLYVMRPAWSYRLNADFEDHAEHEYAHLVEEHAEWEFVPFLSAFAGDYANLDSVADLFRQISFDERVHKEESLAAMAQPRFA